MVIVRWQDMGLIGSFIGKLLKKKRKTTERDKFYKRQAFINKEDEIEDRNERRELRKLRRDQLKQAQYYAKFLPNALAQQRQASEVKHQTTDGKVKRFVKKVRIVPPVLIHRDYYMLRVDTTKLPTGVSIDALKDPKLIETLGFAMQTEVGVDHTDKGRGFWYLVARRGGIGIIPMKINYDEVIKMMPKTASSWAIPIGVGENRKLTWLDVRHRPHFLIAGSSGSGKSVFLKAMLLTLCAKNSPQRLRIILCDFKGGADMVPLVGLPHIGAPSKIRTIKKELIDIDDADDFIEDSQDDFADRLITEPKDLKPILLWADTETNRRNRLFAKQQDITNINEYNARFRTSPLPRVMIVLDEFPVAVLESAKKDADAIQLMVGAIARKGRSAGISIVIGSQIASASVMAGSISQNITTRLAGFSTGPQSNTIMGSWIANRIDNRAGRMAYRDELSEKELQTPWVAPKVVKAMVKEIAELWDGGRDEDATAMKLFRFCLEKAEGIFLPDNLYKHFPDDDEITRQACYDIGEVYVMRETDGQLGPEIEIDGVQFYLLPHIPGVRGKKLVTVEDYQAMQNVPLPETEPAPTEPQYAWTENDVLIWAVEKNNGKLGQRDVYAHYRVWGMTRDISDKFGPERIGKKFTIKGCEYEVVAGSGRLPVRLVTCDSRLAPQSPEIEENPDAPTKGFEDDQITTIPVEAEDDVPESA